jgi:lipoate-protein ligase A
MNYLELTFPDAAQNLACDEALLEMFEQSGGGGELLRLWHPEQYFVVLGHGNKWRDEVNASACAADGIAVLRRSSGGGTVLQGPGCVNYSLILRQNKFVSSHIQAAFDFVLSRHRRALEALTAQPVSVQGLSDLTLGERKFSGNAQYRKREYVLVHGTFLLHFDLWLIEKYLRLPATQPQYRRQRSHCEFLINAEVDPAKLRESLRAAWDADEDFTAIPDELIGRLTSERYRCAGWNEKF